MPPRKVLVVAGAGTSVELGVPAMVGLAEEFLQHAHRWQVEPDLVGRILHQQRDIEHLIEEIDTICSARRSLSTIDNSLPNWQNFDTVRAEVEWFIQHAAERIVPNEAHLMWGATLRATQMAQLTLLTTNYDRAIELAANAEGLTIDDGFAAFENRETSTWTGFSHDNTSARLVKLHGSTDWYADGPQGTPTKLRHPMPLFGRARLTLPNEVNLGSALILPSREKLLTREPYPRLSQTFLNASDHCDFAVVVGSSLRDSHLRAAMQSVAKRVPLFIVNPNADSCGLIGATPLARTASEFLVGVLPGALTSDDPVRVLSGAAKTPHSSRGGILGALKIALDTAASSRMRCQAIESLDDASMGLDPKWMNLLLNDQDSNVARYALGLIAHHPDHSNLFGIAESVAHASNDNTYKQDMRLLREVLEKKDAKERTA